MKKILPLIITVFLLNSGFSQQKYYTNPILSGFYPDPSICRAGDDYYLVNSSFSYFPGLPLFHSKDLVNWKQISNAMSRPEQLNLDGAGVSRGLFAPAISYNKGIFYIVCTLIDKLGNFVITAKDPAGPWSNPVALPQVNGIDPSLFFDSNGKAYILFNSVPPNNIPMHDGHRTIRMFELDAKNLKVIGDEKLLINGGTDMSKKPVWIEGPHIFQKDGWYYLICAEGGTGYNHSEVVFRSKAVDGPYMSYEKNPILTQRHLDPARTNPVTTTGHADFVETKDGKWYAVFLGCRPYEDDYYNIGRETFMAPVEWKDGWPLILEGNETVGYQYPAPLPSLTKNISNPFNGNPVFREDFSKPYLDHRWIFLRTLREKWFNRGDRPGFLSIKLQPATIGGKTNPSFLGYRQQNLNCTATISFAFDPSNRYEKAGIVIFQNERHFYFLCIGLDSASGNTRYVQLYKSTPDSAKTELIKSQLLPNAVKENIRLQIKAEKGDYSFYYSFAGKPLQLLADKVDGKFLSTKVAGGFVGSVFGLYATSSGQLSTNKAYFNWFEYRGNDELYK